MPIETSEILRGLAAREFFPAFQPLVELRTGALAGFEILARWTPPSGQPIPPSQFIPAVEKAGLMHELTAAVLGKAFDCDLILQKPLMLAFNVSATQLLDTSLPQRIEAAAQRGGFPLDRLTIEITESALVDDLPRAASVAQALKALHCRLALDDFGTGYSSLTHLHSLPFDELKVDRSFVASMILRHESREIVASVLGLGQGLGLMSVAEGVETQEQAEMLFGMGCDLAQGWLFGHAVTSEELPAIFSKPLWTSPAANMNPTDGVLLTSVQARPAHRLAQLQAMYDGAPVGLGFLDRDLRYVNLNRKLAEMNGVPAMAHLGRSIAEVIPQTYPLLEPFLKRALAGEPVTGVEITKPASDRNRSGQTVMLSYRCVRDAAGNIVGVTVAVMDITLAKRTQQALKESEDHFRHMMNLSPHVPWILDPKGKVSDASPRWEEYTGQPLSEAMGDGWLKMLHPDDIDETLHAIGRALTTGLPIDVRYRIHSPSGDWKWMRSRGTPRFSSTGQVICIYGVVEELDAAGQVDDRMRKCEAELRTALEAAPVGIVLADGTDGAVVMVNPKAKNKFRSGVFPGQKFTEYERMGLLRNDGRRLPPAEHPLARAIQHGETIDARPFLLYRADGTSEEISISSRPILSDEQQLIGGVMTIEDAQ